MRVFNSDKPTDELFHVGDVVRIDGFGPYRLVAANDGREVALDLVIPQRKGESCRFPKSQALSDALALRFFKTAKFDFIDRN